MGFQICNQAYRRAVLMIDQTKIEWTDFTVNFWEGCQKVGPGCDNCYAEARDVRFTGGSHWGPNAPRRKVKGGIAKLQKINRDAEAFREKHGHWPRVFCSSLSDMFDNAVDPAWRSNAFTAIDISRNTRIQLLTKRVGNVEKMVPPMWRDGGWPRHVGLMITVVNQAEADRDIPKLLDLKERLGIPWVGLSMEPMIEPIRLRLLRVGPRGSGRTVCSTYDALTGEAYDSTASGYIRRPHGPEIDWVIVGGESGPNARPMHPDWVRSLRDQCAEAGTPFLFKQWGEWWPISQMQESDYKPLYKSNRKAKPDEDQEAIDDMCGQYCTVKTLCLQIDGDHRDPLEIDAWGHGAMLAFKTGKKAAGRLLNGRTHDETPEAAA
jgi:protein gp37